MGLLIHWNVDGRPWYPSMDPGQSIAYISDVGAQSLKPLFIAGSCVTTIFLDLSFISDRWLRHRGRLAKNLTMTEKVLSVLSMVFATIGTVGLILLSIFDTLRHPTLHNIFLVLFIAGYVISAIFICWEYQRLGIQYRQHAVLRISFWIKLSFILLEVALAVAFAVTSWKKHYNVAACLEWAIAFIFTFYAFSFFVDLLPAVKTRNGRFGFGNGETRMEMEQNDEFSRQRSWGANGDGYRGTMESHRKDRTLGANDLRSVK